MTFDELVELATLRIYTELREGGGREMRLAVHRWMELAILWSKGQSQNSANDVRRKETP
jgi:hypothetical protein